tara:strand:+ start:465 stop:692 length:228 start_codon:yes stop_codon:yes gene_type:complete
MSLRDDMKIDWEYNDTNFIPPKNPTLSKRLVIENLNHIQQILEEGNDGESPYLAAKRITLLIEDINNDKLKPSNL